MTVFNKSKFLFTAIFWVGLLHPTDNIYASSDFFPGLTNSIALDGANEFVSIYSSYARALSKHYGKAVIFASHLGYPVGEDNMGAFPRTYIGVGGGASFANTNAIKNDSSAEVTGSALPAILPAAGLSLNLGMGISDKWDIRLTALPPITLQLPSDNLKTVIKMTNFKLKLSYNIKKSKTFETGLSVSGYLAYSQGSINIKAENLQSQNRGFSGASGSGTVTDFTYNVTTNASWNYYGIGTEIRAWIDLYAVVPYIGYGLGFQGGLFATEVALDGTIQVDVNGVTETSPANIKVGESAKIPVLSHRFMLGLEFKIEPTPVRLGIEAQFELANKLTGISMGAALQF